MAVTIHPTAVIDCADFVAGDGTIIGAHVRIHGTRVRLGRECFINDYALIGGGSASDPCAFLDAGDWLHVGNYAEINIARGVTIGHEVGIGIGTRVFTHGAYLSEWDGFPVEFASVSIGSNVWLPNAQVNPGTTIGSNVVVAPGSVVSGSIPDGSFAAGTPAVVKGTRYPAEINRDAVARRIIEDIALATGIRASVSFGVLHAAGVMFDLDNRTVKGPVTSESEQVKNQLRRRGIRFRYEDHDGFYRPW